MCGIAGVLSSQGEVEPAVFENLARTLTHRGPDDHGVYSAGGIGLLQTRLSIIGVSTGHQPMLSVSGDLVLVANGEIYNYIELRKHLESCGHQFRTQSDSECILHGYREYGTQILEKLQGMFAFAIYDAERRQLFLARDRIGIKPLYYTCQGGCFFFASEIKALLAVSGAHPVLQTQALAQCLQNNFSTGSETPVKDIYRLQAAQAMVVNSQAKLKCWNYWQAEHQPQKLSNLAQATEAFEELMPAVIDHHLRSDVPIGLFLSGGVDSSSLLAMMKKQYSKPIHTFSLGFPGTGVHNELKVAAATARLYGTVHTGIEVQREEMLNRLPLALWAADDLMLDHAALPTLLLAEYAARQLKVVFTGEGGDEVFAGYGRYRSGVLKRLLNTLRGRPLGGFRSQGNFSAAWFNRVFCTQLRGADWHKPTRTAWDSTPSMATRLERMQRVDIQTWLADDLLVKADRMLMANGLEGRVPWLDHRVVEFGLMLADQLKIQGRSGKVFLRHWAGEHLPKSVLTAPKSGFSVPVRDWLDRDFIKHLEDILPRQPVIQYWCSVPGVKALLSRQSSHGDVSRGVWTLLCLALWQRLADSGFSRPGVDADPLQLLADS